jgi:hypothetical protein
MDIGSELKRRELRGQRIVARADGVPHLKIFCDRL